MQIKVSQFNTYAVKTNRGTSTSISISDPKGVQYSAWAGDWSKFLKVGDIIEADVQQNSKNGKTYNNLSEPKIINPTQGGAAVSMDLTSLVSAIKDLTAAIKQMSSGGQGADPFPPQDDAPPPGEEDMGPPPDQGAFA